jgi:hypothetical protein
MGPSGGRGRGAGESDRPKLTRVIHKDRTRRRQQRIDEFVKQQRIAREWITFAEIANWCAASVTGASSDAEDQARRVAYDRLDRSARDGEFERAGYCQGRATSTRSKILYLDALVTLGGASPRFRLTREQLGYVDHIRDLPGDCWLPRELVRRWLAAHSYPWPEHFDPMQETRTDDLAGIRTRTSPGGAALSPGGGAPPLLGKALDDALDKWALDQWGKDLTKLPSRDDLLRLARTRPEFNKVTQQDIRALRRRQAPDEIKRGGGRRHRQF